MPSPSSDPRQAVVAKVKAFWPQIVAASHEHGIDPAILAGLVCQESAGDPQAKRHEPRYRWLFGDDPGEQPRLPAGETMAQDLEEQRWSYGLCQVMGAVAREHGYSGHLEDLADPAINLDLGAKHLRAKIRQAHGDLRGGLLLYNGGGNKAYPERVLAWAKEFQPQPASAN